MSSKRHPTTYADCLTCVVHEVLVVHLCLLLTSRKQKDEVLRLLTPKLPFQGILQLPT